MSGRSTGFIGFLILLALVFAAAVGAVVYVTACVHRVFTHERLKGVPKKTAWLLSCIPAVACIPLSMIFGVFPVALSVVHLAIFLLLCDALGALFFRKADPGRRKRVCAVVATILCAVYLAAGAVNAVTIVQTDYALATEKSIGSEGLRIVQISDCHMGSTFDAEGFERQIEIISAAEPDVLVITGDFVDESTTFEDMLGACAALGRAKTKHGVFFAMGNHDSSRMRGRREFDAAQLISELERCGVVVLRDEAVLVDDRFYICGRMDATEPYRASAQELTAPLDKSKYIIMLDHQPVEYVQESEAGVDLLLSGHTHGGQMLPLTLVIGMLNVNDQGYGMKYVGDTACIVSSGMSGWGLPVRTGVPTEYVLIEVEGK